MKIAIIGSGISGLIAALLLQKKHDITIFEAEPWVGGHVHTVPVHDGDKTIMIDTGFIVCNDRNYPNFNKLLNNLDVSLQKTLMSFSVATENASLEYNGTNLNGIFSQRKNLLNIKFWNMLRDIYKFNYAAKKNILNNNINISLGDFINNLDLSYECKEYYLYPMIAAIWSTKISEAINMPAIFICKFFDNHGLLSIFNRPQWFTVTGGSKVYVDRILAQLKTQPLTNTPVQGIKRHPDSVDVIFENNTLKFDHVIIATHSDQALKILLDPSDLEANILSQILYKNNTVTLHTDVNLMPKNKRAWASWNYHVDASNRTECMVTYYMNLLQNFDSKVKYFVSLNQHHKINATDILGVYNYAHPILGQNAIRAQNKHDLISGVNRTYYCGAYWGSGFHESGVNSGLKAVKKIDKELFCTAQFILD